MLTPIVHDLLVSYATTRGALLRADRADPFLHEFLRREYLDAHGDLYDHLWKFTGGRIEAGRVVITADSEGSVSLRTRGPASPARKASPCPN